MGIGQERREEVGGPGSSWFSTSGLPSQEAQHHHLHFEKVWPNLGGLVIYCKVFFCEKVQRRLYQTPSPSWFSTSNLPTQEAHHAWNNIEISVKSGSVECCEKLKTSLSYSKETKAGIFPKNSMSLGLEYCLWLGGSEDMVQTKRPRIALKCRKLLPQVQVHVEFHEDGQNWKANRLLVSREADFIEKLQGECCCVWFSLVRKNLGQAD